MDNIAHPGDEPAHFIGESMQRFELITHPDGNLASGVVIRPWLQAFRWRTKTYSPEYIKIQVETARAKGGIGFLFWNAANDYSKPYEAMPEMRAAKIKKRARKPSTSAGMSSPASPSKPASRRHNNFNFKNFCHPERGLVFAPQRKDQPQSKDPCTPNRYPTAARSSLRLFSYANVGRTLLSVAFDLRFWF